MVPASTPPADDEIARVAHGLWEAEGRPGGRDLEHWTRARRMIEEGRTEIAPAEGATPSSAPEDPAPSEPARGGPAAESRKPRRDRLAGEVARRPEERPEPASATPGPRNPEPMPPTTAEGHVEVPSVEDVAAGAVSDDPRPPGSQPRAPRRAR